MTTKLEQAIEVLSRAQNQLISELAVCGEAGGVGRAQNYAPIFVQVHTALEIAKGLVVPATDVEPTPEQLRMAAVRAAKASKSV